MKPLCLKKMPGERFRSRSQRSLGAEGARAAYFRRVTSPSIAWQFEQKLTAPDGASGDLFGAAVAINSKFGNRVLIGAPGNDVGGVDSGAAYLYDFNGSTWVSDGPRIEPLRAGDSNSARRRASPTGLRPPCGMPGHRSTGALSIPQKWSRSPTLSRPTTVSRAISSARLLT
ncbi:MAG: FG-GAP repeat protein [Chloroflexi bacterium]|nr:FG-GAP repeat protein [Chloroflexota bacterium]